MKYCVVLLSRERRPMLPMEVTSRFRNIAETASFTPCVWRRIIQIHPGKDVMRLLGSFPPKGSSSLERQKQKTARISKTYV